MCMSGGMKYALFLPIPTRSPEEKLDKLRRWMFSSNKQLVLSSPAGLVGKLSDSPPLSMVALGMAEQKR